MLQRHVAMALMRVDKVLEQGKYHDNATVGQCKL